jgi:16S rRNA (cytosine1402-N4)-methyltransferase
MRGAASSPKSKGVQKMLPNVLQPSATDHVPVLANEVRDSLAVQPGDTVVDATFGAGGHSAILAAELHGRGKLIAIDRDPTARTYFDRFEKRAGVQARLLRGDFSVVLEQLAENGVRADAILLDLGVSSMQLDRPERGFSYSVDAPLDMRMDPTQDLSAAEVVNEWPERELTTIFRRYGEERYAKQIARAIVRRRKEQPFERTGELVDTIKCAIPAPARFGDGHPAKRVFQALRIAVNDELGALEAALPAALEMLRPGGRLAVIAFHSLEDRIVKQFLRDRERGCTCPPDFPVCVCGNEPELRAVERRPVKPSQAEVAANPRAASARLRAAVKAGEAE